jgi:NAD(P)-dependent dehydrogenase (short-subunit alcohol dehydrogenase family)
MTTRLRDRRIVITGAASGIGRRTAQLFAEHGAALTLLDRDAEGLAELARETGGHAFEADITEESSVVGAVERGASAMGGIDGVVNAAGVMLRGSVLEVDVAQWRRVLEINLTGTYIVVRSCLPWLTQAPFATIVNIGSGQALLPNAPDRTAYAASKGGVINPTRALAAGLRRRSVPTVSVRVSSTRRWPKACKATSGTMR